MTEMMLARHGQNEDNLNGILNGHRDLPLTDLGREQARQLGEGIAAAGLTFDAILSSPLSRAFETAEIAAARANLPVPEVMDLLIERNFGIMTGRPISDVIPMCSPDVFVTDTITYFLSPEGAETFPQLIERGKKVLDEVKRRYMGKRVLMVGHGDMGKMIYAAATGKHWMDVLKDFHFGNGDLIDIASTGDVHKIKLPQFNS